MRAIEFVLKRTAVAFPVAVCLLAAGAGIISAQDAAQTATVKSATKEKNIVAGEVEAKRLLLLMDRDQSGKVSRKEFMDFMAEEFDRLDVNKDGELDVKELTQTRLTAPPRGAIHR
jgi:Ca2+-binding EF-hand superfamily protein